MTTPHPSDLPNSHVDDTDRLPHEVQDGFDWTTWYLLDEDDVGQNSVQLKCILLLVSIMSRWVQEKGWDHLFVGSDQYVAWNPDHPLVRMSPDVYIIEPPGGNSDFDSIQTWRPGHVPPPLAVEIVSQDWHKDYHDAHLRYAQMGVRELVVFDPTVAAAMTPPLPGLADPARGLRQPLQIWIRDEQDRFVRTGATGQHPFYSAQIDAWWVVTTWPGEGPRLRIARDSAGMDRVLSHQEFGEREREARLQERAARLEEREAIARRLEAALGAGSADNSELQALVRELRSKDGSP